jgi:hypothetical protein
VIAYFIDLDVLVVLVRVNEEVSGLGVRSNSDAVGTAVDQDLRKLHFERNRDFPLVKGVLEAVRSLVKHCSPLVAVKKSLHEGQERCKDRCGLHFVPGRPKGPPKGPLA